MGFKEWFGPLKKRSTFLKYLSDISKRSWHDITQVTSHELYHARQQTACKTREFFSLQVLELYEDQSGQSKINLVVQILMVSLKQKVWSANGI